jgi:hypothetical protein
MQCQRQQAVRLDAAVLRIHNLSTQLREALTANGVLTSQAGAREEARRDLETRLQHALKARASVVLCDTVCTCSFCSSLCAHVCWCRSVGLWVCGCLRVSGHAGMRVCLLLSGCERLFECLPFACVHACLRAGARGMCLFSDVTVRTARFGGRPSLCAWLCRPLRR